MGSCSWDSLVLPQNSEMAFGRCSYSAKTTWQYLARLGQGSPESCVCSESVANQYIMLFFPQPGLMGPGGGTAIILLVTH